MPRTVAIGEDFFAALREKNAFYVDKTDFIRQWWDGDAKVTAIMRPRRFGKTLAMDMVECFLSTKYAGRGELFDGLSIWQEERFRALQGTYPVLFLSFAEVKFAAFQEAKRSICGLMQNLYLENKFLLEGDLLQESEREQFARVNRDMPDDVAAAALRDLMGYLFHHYKKKVIVLLDEYDTPLQEAYAHGYWEQMVTFLRPIFGTTLKGNPYLERALMTGITRVAKESIFSDLNNLDVVTTTSEKYEDCFGFTQQEVTAALKEFGLSAQMRKVRALYDGFTFGRKTDIYNPWSITNYLEKRKLLAYWVNTSSNTLISELIRRGSSEVKMDCERLLAGKSIQKPIDEQIILARIETDDNALWSLLLASGYLKVLAVDAGNVAEARVASDVEQDGADFAECGVAERESLDEEAHANAGNFAEDDFDEADGCGDYDLPIYTLALTNGEVRHMFRSMVQRWFTTGAASSAYHNFLSALMDGDVEDMNFYLNRVTQSTFSFFDTNGQEPERFYHGFVLGLMVSLGQDYFLWSNRESGRGRYDVVLEPRDRKERPAIILELKVRERKQEKDLEATVQRALEQIAEKKYDQELLARGFVEDQIRKYGFAFDGKEVRVG